MKLYHRKNKKKILYYKKKQKIYNYLEQLNLCSIIKIIIKFFILLIILFWHPKSKKSDKEQTPNINTKIKVAMCTVCKRENKYIKHFIEYHKKLGYNHFYLYDRNDIGDEKLTDVQAVRDGIKEGFITVIPFHDPASAFAAHSYYDCYENYSSLYDWLSFFDVDEYLVLEPRNSSIQDFLDNPRYNNCENIQFNWRVFTDNEKLDYEDKPLIERFPVESDYKYERKHIKSTIRGKLDYNKFKRNESPHSVYDNIKACTCSGKETNTEYYTWPADLEYASLNHYVTKTVREFFEKRYRERGDPDKMDSAYKSYGFYYFFRINKKTKEKVDIYNQLFHTNYQ